MSGESTAGVRETMAAINRAWRENRPSDMRPFLHPDVTAVLPGFSGTVAGRESLLASFDEFCSNARVLEYEERDEGIHVVGNVAVVHYRFQMLHERAAHRERSTGRDVWVFERAGAKWIAVWRTMVELHSDRDPGG
jgi:hypothetical protein